MKNSLFILVILISLYLQPINAQERIVSLAPSQTELLFAIGADKEIVGVSDYSDFPNEAKKLPHIGGVELNIEKIVSLSPTILVDVNSMRKRYEPLFNRLRLKYVNYNINNPEDVASVAVSLGKEINKIKQSEDFANNWLKELNELKFPQKKFTFYAEIWSSPIQAAGKNSFISKIIEKAGGVNVFKESMEYPSVNQENVLCLNPEVIILCYPTDNEAIEKVKSRPAWKFISAVKNNKVIAVNQDFFVRPGPRNLDGIKQICEILNKER